MSAPILIRRAGRHAVLTLNRPEKRNPLPYLPEHGFLPALRELAGERGVRAVVLTGAGQAFCSGLDLDALQALQQATPAQNLADSRKIRDCFEFLRAYPKPLVAAVQGPAVAGGAGLVLCCDLAVMAGDASLAFTEVKVGFVPAVVGAYLQLAVGDRVARDLILTARAVPAQECLRLNLANEVVPAAQVLARAEARAEAFAELSPQALAATRDLLARMAGLPLKAALVLASQANAKARGSPDCKEGVRAFLDKRKPHWDS